MKKHEKPPNPVFSRAGGFPVCQPQVARAFLLFTKQKGPRRGAARKTSRGECGQRFISLTGPVALCSRMMRSISYEIGRRQIARHCVFDAGCGVTELHGFLRIAVFQQAEQHTRHIGVAGTDAVNDVDVGIGRLRVKNASCWAEYSTEVKLCLRGLRTVRWVVATNFFTPYSCA